MLVKIWLDVPIKDKLLVFCEGQTWRFFIAGVEKWDFRFRISGLPVEQLAV